MNHLELVAAVARETGLTHRQAKGALAALAATLAAACAAGAQVHVTDLGTFSAPTQPARIGRNPRTGEPVEIPAKRRPRFSAGRRYRERVAE